MTQVSAPLFFDVVSSRREDQEGKNVLHTYIALAGVPLFQGHQEIVDLEDDAAISTLTLQERERIGQAFGFVIRDILVALEAASKKNPNTQEELTNA